MTKQEIKMTLATIKVLMPEVSAERRKELKEFSKTLKQFARRCPVA